MKRILLWLMVLSLPALADPCGMVPPISLEETDSQITRVGEQLTYAFFKDGLETVVIHPGFRGNVDEFGMLIPFPNPPALRKVPENIFPQLANAVTPPTITYYLYQYELAEDAGPVTGMSLESRSAPRDKDEVVVLKEEAVGMYEVAVLEAGSAAALKRWMDQHGFRFPDGMEPVCNDYIEDRWCFVAVKTRVGQKSRVDPRPGMRQASVSKPAEAVFSGKVQAMGFRFRSAELVIPMRLSTYNGGDLNNTVYIVAEEPLRAANLPLELVKKQLSGEKLYANLTELLPYRLEGGNEDDMSPNDWTNLAQQRNPEPLTGTAAELFATDLLAGEEGRLSHHHEEQEKSLLDIGERLNLRGGRLEQLHQKELAQARARIKAESLQSLKRMSLTVLEGEFPREVIAHQNITFQPYRLDGDASAHRPGTYASQAVTPQGDFMTKLLAPLGLILTALFWRSSRRTTVAALLGMSFLLLSVPRVEAQDGLRTISDWIEQLDEPEHSKKALEQLKRRGKAAYPYLIARYKNEEASPVERGYCLALLAEKPDRSVKEATWAVATSSRSALVKLWSQAALVNYTESPKELLALLDPQFAKSHGDPDGRVLPLSAELQRPIALRLREWESELSLEQQLRFLGVAERAGGASNVSPTVRAVVSPALREATPAQLVELMFRSDSQDVRRLSAAVLAGFKEEKRKAVFAAVMEQLQVDSRAEQVPWAGGALFLPQFSQMNKSEATELITGLTRWSVWTDLHKTPENMVRPLENNLRSYSLWTAAGGGQLNWRNARGGKEWLQAFGKLRGADAVASLLREQQVPRDSAFWAVVKLLK